MAELLDILDSLPAALIIGTQGLVTSGPAGVGTLTPDSKSILDIESTILGFLMPRMTAAQRDAITTPPLGLELFNNTNDRPNFVTASGDWLNIAGNPDNIIEVSTQDDWDKLGATINITVNTTILIKTSISTTAVITIDPGVNFSLLGEDLASSEIFYTGGSTFITSDGVGIFRIFGIGRLDGNGTGTLFNIINGQSFFRTSETAIANWLSIGTITDSQAFEIVDASVGDIATALVLDDVTNIGLNRANFINPLIDSNDAHIKIKSSKGSNISAIITSLGSILNPNETLVRVDPAIGGGSIIVVTNTVLRGTNKKLFTLDGSTGAFTAVADTSVATESITSVTDNVGIARFNFTAPPQTLLILSVLTWISF